VEVRRLKTFQAFLFLCLLLALPGIRLSLADEPGYTMEWWTVDGGGVVRQHAILPYSLGGTAGQADAALWQGGGYTLQGGFWRETGIAANYHVYLPLVLRQ
jgi:hypothetical protein